MATPTHRSVSGLRQTSTSGAPRTPSNRVPSTTSTLGSFSSPSALRAEEDCIILSVGIRRLSVGFASDATPKCILDYGPNTQRRQGDYRQWIRGYEKGWRERAGHTGGRWGGEWELYTNDLREVDLGLVGDRLERAVREAVTKYLVTGSSRRMMLVLQPEVPLPLLRTLLDTFFRSFSPPSISLGSAPVLCAVAAGLRSALVVDIGWQEATVCAVYEYREVMVRRSVRAGRRCVREMLEVLCDDIRECSPMEERPNTKLVSFEETEEVFVRIGWCRPTPVSSSLDSESELGEQMKGMKLDDEGDEINLKLRSTEPPMTLKLPFPSFSLPAERGLFATGIKPADLDDEELPLHILIYRTLLHLPVDVRSTVMSRLIITGGVSNMPGLKSRILSEVQSLVDREQWNPVYGGKDCLEKLKSRSKQKQHGPSPVPISPTESEKGGYHDGPVLAAGLQSQTADPIEAHIRREKNKGVDPAVEGTLRAVESMGAWAGGSLVSCLRVGLVSTVEREQWMAHGMAGAGRKDDGVKQIDKVKNRQSMKGLGKGSGEEVGWALGAWA